ncbi:hypothetical protein AS29_020475 [Bacillus sp. SJS]|nr:hypothetical protein AS29_020475 [Bacillus sp. SJS]
MFTGKHREKVEFMEFYSRKGHRLYEILLITIVEYRRNLSKKVYFFSTVSSFFLTILQFPANFYKILNNQKNMQIT